MKLQTVHYGEVEVSEEHVIHFEAGLPGFEELQKFIVIEPDKEIPFCFMQSVENEHISFIIADPFTFYPDYAFVLSDDLKEELQINSQADLLIYCIVTTAEKLVDATINLMAPVIVNIRTKQGRQMILHHAAYKTKHRLLADEHQQVGSAKED